MAEEARPSQKREWFGRGLWLTLAAILALNLFMLLRAPASGGTAASGKEAPAFTGRLATGESATLGDYRGKVVLLDFWATWCAPCLAEMPVLERLQKRYAARPFSVLGINAEGHDTDAAQIASFTRQRGLTYPNLVDDGTIAHRYGVDMIPHLVLVDREGRVRHIWNGGAGESEISAEIEPLLR